MSEERIEGCHVSWNDCWGKKGIGRSLSSVTVRHSGKNVVEFTRPHTGQVVRKRLAGKKLSIHAPDGRDLVAAWRAA